MGIQDAINKAVVDAMTAEKENDLILIHKTTGVPRKLIDRLTNCNEAWAVAVEWLKKEREID
jgi:acyl CoA:acetate/3-ketoacid CoA transferase alpha subunit